MRQQTAGRSKAIACRLEPLHPTDSAGVEVVVPSLPGAEAVQQPRVQTTPALVRRVARGGQGRVDADLPIFRAMVVHPEQTMCVPELQRQAATAAPELPRTPTNATAAETAPGRR